MNFRLLSVLAVSGALIASPVLAAGNFYAGGSLSASITSDYDFNAGNTGSQTRSLEFDPAFGVDGRAGYDFGDIRAELELGYKHLGVDSVSPGSNADGDIGAYSVMLNGAYDFDIGSDFTPYVGAGVGALFAWGDVSYTGQDGATQDKNVYGVAPAAQIGVGTAYTVSEEVDLIGGYGLLGAPSDEGNEDNVILIHSLKVGVNFKF